MEHATRPSGSCHSEGTTATAAARSVGFEPISLGARVLRADTAPLAVLAWCALQAPG